MRTVDFVNLTIALFFVGLIVFSDPGLEAGRRVGQAAIVVARRAVLRLARLVQPPLVVVTGFGLLLMASVLSQADDRSMASAYILLIYIALALVAVAIPKLGLAMALFWLFRTLYRFAGSPHPTLDIALLVAALAAAVYLVLSDRQWRPTWRWPTDIQALLIALIFLPLAWPLVSVGDYVTEGISRISPSPPASSTEAGDPHRAKIGLAMSGGGYRAALFHAGVVSALEQFHIPIQVMSSVSGASIFASFYSRGGTPDQFLDAVVRGSFRLERYILRIDNALCLLASARISAGSGNFRILPFSPGCSRTTMQSRLLDHTLLGDVPAKAGSVEGRPELMLATTDIAEGRMIGFPEHLAHLPSDQPLSALVAASGAFPGALPSYRIHAPYTVKNQRISHMAIGWRMEA
ncbi:patatin-like phospholipase family protein [Bradyrhizobium jicamae]|uniref:Patatin-like phospholipase family protein n=1 Tax=Bradyrhizobium jicamae TaxID=280332 RepID=A0ABS5FWL5_9BRAD|nr:patatin-like phospholipase family protein [Bradyrhizobium jicamae]MBR0801259.1 patatin-like phospholipase family protein [Bradyrhizobium jicamae]